MNACPVSAVPTPSPVGDPPLSCAVVSTAAELEGLQAEWRALLRRSAADSPTLDPLWLLPWWRVYGEGTGRQLRLCLFREGRHLVGLAALLRRRYWYGRCLPFARLEPLGADVDEDDGVASDYLNLIAEAGAEGRVARALAGALAAGRAGRCDELVLPRMDGTLTQTERLAEALAAAGFRTERAVGDTAPFIPLPARWEDYLQALGKHRRFLVRTLRAFETWAGGNAVFRLAATPVELEEGKRVLLALHAERWGGAGREGVFRASRFAAFHDAVLPQLLAEGALQLWWLKVRGEPLAAVYNILWNGRVFAYQSGRKLDVPREVRPGIVLHAHAIGAAIAAGCREYDFLAGGARYKTELAPASRPLVTLRAVRPGPAEALRRLASRGLNWARRARHVARAALGRFRPARDGGVKEA
jgi:CelD/BcsL family acetyltransferase involved in cellulose biosynthesis